MKKLEPTIGSQAAGKWLDEEMEKQLSVETDIARKRLITMFYARQQKAIQCLELIRTDDPQKKQQLELASQEKWLQILLHPAGNLVLPALILVLALFRLNILTAVACVLMLIRTVILLLVKPRKETEDPPFPKPYVDDEELAGFLREQRNAIAIDVDSVMSSFTTVNVKEHKGTVNDLITAFLALYEAQVDAPDNEDLAYPLSVLRACMHRSGLEVVSYSPETAGLFDVMEVDYVSQQRTPAIRNREDGIIVKKGLYLNEKK